MTDSVDERLRRLQAELAGHERIARHLGLDFERPVRSLGDGYPENTVALVGKIAERLLKQLWSHHDVPGDPSGKALNDLIKGCRPHIRSTNVINALTDIQRLRNRSTHDGYEIAEEDGLLAVRRLLDVLDWFTNTGLTAVTGDAPRLDPLVEKKAEFLAGLHATLGYRTIKRFELSESTVYQLFCRQAGLRVEYIEIMLSGSLDELHQLMRATGGELLHTKLPKRTRFLVVQDEPTTDVASFAGSEIRIVAYDRFVERIVDVPGHLAGVAGTYPEVGPEPAATARRITADLLDTNVRTGETAVSETDDAADILESLARNSANVLVIGGPGSGKTTLLKNLAVGSDRPAHRYRFYLDMSLKQQDESFEDFVTRILAPDMSIPRNRVFDVFLYLIRAGSVLCVLDAIDEAVPTTSLEAFLGIFTDVAQALSAESTVVMSSRYSFLADSPQVRRLLNSSSLISERLVQQLHASGVNPLELPRFAVVRLHELPAHQDAGEDVVSPLELQLAEQTSRHDAVASVKSAERLAQLVEARVDQVLSSRHLTTLRPRLETMLGLGFLTGKTLFSLAEICSELGISSFGDGRVTAESFLLAPLFRGAGRDAVAPVHTVFQEYFAARFLSTAEGRAEAAGLEPEPLLTEQVRQFLYAVGAEAPTAAALTVPAGSYLVGPSHRLLIRTIESPVLFDEFPVTVARYKAFLGAVERHGCGAWDHPDAPAGHSHEPWQERLRNPEYYTDPAYADYPATCVSWWSAVAFAKFEGKRLPTSAEWEAAARGADGRLFPWGDAVDLAAANCADSCSGRPLVTYEVWKEEIDRGGLRDCAPAPVTAYPDNTSPIGVRGMSGNVWEWTDTVFGDVNSAVICGGSYDNPYRAVQTHSKALYVRRGASNAVGFRCVKDAV